MNEKNQRSACSTRLQISEKKARTRTRGVEGVIDGAKCQAARAERSRTHHKFLHAY